MKVLLTGGGTGGHIYPALALMRRLREVRPDTEFIYVGTDRGLESKLVPDQNIPFRSIKIEGFKRKLNLEGIKYNLNTIRLFLKSIKEARKIIREFKPDVVLGTGGYVCAPVCYAASKEGVATIIHEQNSVAGVTNKFLARYVDKIAICFDEAYDQFNKHEQKIVFTGNPRAQEVAGIQANNELEEYGLNPDKETVLIFGGSRGANKINDTFVDAYGDLSEKEYQILFATGEIHFEKIREKLIEVYGPTLNPQNISIAPYIENMPQVFAGVSLVVGRSGATTLAELTALGMPSVLIPSPNVTEDHQTKNALSLVNKQAALMIKENELSKDKLIQSMDTLMLDRPKRKDMEKRAKESGKPFAADELIQVLLDTVKEKNAL
jgi:UDP-N-acetylglucosamine--N-acetylmuramyl-(pentapeptide) pyrophosphoryl-undecaprenol N-acetylglucosamine transferase